MEDKSDTPAREQLKAWTKKQLDATVHKLMEQGVVDSLIVEAKPAWVLPFQILIGKIRAHGRVKDFAWFICGEVPTDFLESTVAATPREAARHFSMKWQLQASQYRASDGLETHGTRQDDSKEEPGGQLADQAEALYSLVDEPGLWLAE